MYFHVHVHISSTLLAASREGENESSQVAECSECTGLPDYQEEGEEIVLTVIRVASGVFPHPFSDL